MGEKTAEVSNEDILLPLRRPLVDSAPTVTFSETLYLFSVPIPYNYCGCISNAYST